MTRQRRSPRRSGKTDDIGMLLRGVVVLVVGSLTAFVALAFLSPPSIGSELPGHGRSSSSSSSSTTPSASPSPAATTWADGSTASSSAEPSVGSSANASAGSSGGSTAPGSRATPEPSGTGSATSGSGTAGDVPAPVVGDAAAFHEDFTTPAAAGGQFASTYAGSWQPYVDGTGGKYWSGALVSAHDGVMDVAMDGTRGAAGVFGPPASAWARTGGTFSIRMKVEGGAGNGTAVMLWPTSNDASEGEVDYPEGSFSAAPAVFHHMLGADDADRAQGIRTGVRWQDWHTYTMEWVPGVSMRYFLDGRLIGTVTHSVPTTPHRYTFQIGDVGKPGHVLIDWVSIN